MNSRLQQEVLTLSEAKRWLECIEEDAEQDEVDRGLRTAIRGYISELQYRAGMAKPYRDDLDRLYEVKRAVRSLGCVYDRMGELAGNAVMLPAEVRALHMFITKAVMDLGRLIFDIEQQLPDWAEYFASERKLYAQSLLGIGPLAGEYYDQRADSD
jgi:hypothetical protein